MKKTLSVILSFAIALTVTCGLSTTSSNAADSPNEPRPCSFKL